MSDQKPAPCPYCGNPADVDQNSFDYEWYVVCGNPIDCGARGPSDDRKTVAVDAWNMVAKRAAREE